MSKTLTQRLAKFARKHASDDPVRAAQPHYFLVKDQPIQITAGEAELLKDAILENYVTKTAHEALRKKVSGGCFCAPLYKDTDRRMHFGDILKVVRRDGSVDEGRLQAIHFNKGPVIILSFVGCDHERLIRFCEQDGDYAILVVSHDAPADADGKPIAIGAFVREAGWMPEDPQFDTVGKVVSIDDDGICVDFAEDGEDKKHEMYQPNELTQKMRPLDANRKVCSLHDIMHNPQDPNIAHYGVVTDIVNHFTVEVTFDDTGKTELWHAKYLVHGRPVKTTQDPCDDGEKVKVDDRVWSTKAYDKEDLRVAGWPADVIDVYPPNLCKVVWRNPWFPSAYPKTIVNEVPVKFLTHVPRAFDAHGNVLDESVKTIWPVDSTDRADEVALVKVIDSEHISVASKIPDHNGIKESNEYTAITPDHIEALIETMSHTANNPDNDEKLRRFAREWSERLSAINAHGNR